MYSYLPSRSADQGPGERSDVCVNFFAFCTYNWIKRTISRAFCPNSEEFHECPRSYLKFNNTQVIINYPLISRLYYLITIYDIEKQKSSHELFSCVHEEASQSFIQRIVITPHLKNPDPIHCAVQVWKQSQHYYGKVVIESSWFHV